MSQCSIRNKNTGEPKLFYTSNKGELFTSLYEVLNNTDTSYNIGFLKEDNSFIGKIEVPIFDENTVNGRIQKYIKNGYLDEKQLSENTFIAVDEMAADILERELLSTTEYNSFKRNGLEFSFNDFKLGKSSFLPNSVNAAIDAVELYTKLGNSVKERPVKYDEKQLLDMIVSFMKKIGFSFSTIENYKNNHILKFGVEPDAKALIDLNQKIVAVANGEALLEELPEEFSHFVIESWDQSEINRMLKTVNNTSEYIEFAQRYREIYSKQISDPIKLEEAVRREVLGKLLSNALKGDFSIDSKTDTEINFYNKLIDILNNFINFIKSKLNYDLNNSINEMARDIKNRLYNETLSEKLNPNLSPVMSVMYSVSDSTLKNIEELVKTPDNVEITTELQKEVDQLFNTILSVATSANKQLDELESEEITPQELSYTIEQLLDTEVLATRAWAHFSKLNINSPQFRNQDIESLSKFKNYIVQKGEKALKELTLLKGNYNNVQQIHNKEVVLEKTIEKYEPGKSPEEINKIINNVEYGINRVQTDTWGFIRLFGHTFKTSNLFVRQLAVIIASLHNTYVHKFMQDMQEYMSPLIPYIKKMKDFIEGSYFKSSVDVEKVDEAMRNFELKILKEVYPNIYGSLTLEEYSDVYQQFGIKELKEKNSNYYKYLFLYDSEVVKEDWLDSKIKDRIINFNKKIKDLGIKGEVWNNDFYIAQKNLSKNRSDDNIILEQRRADSNPYNSIGELKHGFKSYFYKDVKNNPNIDKNMLVSINPRHDLFGGKEEPNDKDIVFLFDNKNFSKDAELAFNYMKWNNITISSLNKGNDLITRDSLKDNFEKEYRSFIKSLDKKGLPKVERTKEIIKWLDNSLLFEATDEYWMNTEPSGINFDEFYNSGASMIDMFHMNMLERRYKELALQKRLILRKYKLKNDYKEVNIGNISLQDKDIIAEIEDKMSNIVRGNVVDDNGNPIENISKLFEKNDITSLYISSNNGATLRFNQAFNEYFESIIGKPFEMASIKEVDRFFSDRNNFNISRYGGTLANLKRDLKNNNKSTLLQNYKNSAKELGLKDNEEGVLKAFYIMNSPSWYKRYDANESYDDFIKSYKSGKINVEELVENYLNSSSDQIYYKGEPLSLMRITPSYKFSVPFEEKIEDLYDEYFSSQSDEDKYDILNRMAGLTNISEKYKSDFNILNNKDDLKVYIMMMDAHLIGLKKEDSLNKKYIFLRPQQRITDYERISSFVEKGNKWEQVKDYFSEQLSFRPDDNEYDYKSKTIPKYGYYKLNKAEITDDVFHSLVWRLNNANLREQRQKHWKDAIAMKQGFEALEFENGKKPTDTNYYKMMAEMFDYNFYGKTTPAKVQFKVPGSDRVIDLSKFLIGLKHLGVKTSLAFSPIVGITNFTSGITQNLLMSATGRTLYSTSNNRAAKTLSKMFPDSIKDIGKFDPESKINKIMYSFGVYNIVDRYKNSQYNTVLRLLPQAGFAAMSITNFPLQAQSTLSKLMEYRLIDGKFQSWREFSISEKTKNPTISDGDIKSKFDSYEQLSMYDFIDDDGNFKVDYLNEKGYKGDIERDKVFIMSAIRNIVELTTMEIANYNEGSAGRDPSWGFVLSLKKWLVLATSNMFSRRRYDIDGEEEGLIFSYKYVYKILKDFIKDKKNLKESYAELDEVARKNVKASMTISATLFAMLTLTILLKKAADDDDEEDNYMLQLLAYMSMRNLNETFSGNVGIGQAYYEAVQNPIMLGTTLKNMTNIIKFDDIGEEVQSGKYKGMDKYVSGIIKATSLRNPYTVSSSNTLNETRKSYEFFNKENSFYHIFDLIPNEDNNGK